MPSKPTRKPPVMKATPKPRVTRKPAKNSAISDALLGACGYDVIERIDSSDPAEMLGPLVPNPYQDEGFDDDVEDNGGPDE